MIENLRKDLKKASDKRKAKLLQRFFKTGKGEYGEGDLFLGISVPESRKIAVKFRELGFFDLLKLLKSKFHEERLIALLILVLRFEKTAKDEKSSFTKAAEDKEKIYNFYVRNRRYVNNWDLVDLTAPKIMGVFLKDKNKKILYKFAKSKNIWERRIAILSTFFNIYNKDCRDALRIASILKNDRHDLIQKAVGWMLREIGKRCSLKKEREFLKKHSKTMPRTMLRYAIERFPEKERQKFLK